MPDATQDWTDEQWLAWLAEGDVVTPHTDPEQRERNRRPPLRDGLGAKMLGAGMRGLNDAIYGPKDEPAIVIDATGDSPDLESLDVQLDPDHPERSVVVVRPWLLRQFREKRG